MSRAATAAGAADRGRGSALEFALDRGVDTYRVLSWLYAVVMVWHRLGDFHRPLVALAVVLVLGLWTVFVLLVRRRIWPLLAVELALACAGILLTRVADSPENIAAGATTLPATWAASPVMGCAVLGGWRGGLAAALVVGAADILEVGAPTEGTVYNLVLLLLIGGCLGWCVDVARSGQRALDEAMRVRAEIAERDRLARSIHDGVLQNLAFIHRRGQQLGGPSADLADLAAESERELRDLVQGRRGAGQGRSATLGAGAGTPESSAPASPAAGAAGAAAVGTGDADLGRLLAASGSARVSVAAPAEPVLLEAGRAQELALAVRAALDNVTKHAGPDAKAWVLIEDLGTDVTVTVRDDGVGCTPQRLAEAKDAGRLGVSQSICGRVADLGGTANVRSTPGRGTTVVLTVPLVAPPQREERP